MSLTVDIDCDILIVGASLGGCAAALAAARHGAQVCLVEAGTWFGGQLTAQGVCTPDDTESIETVGSTATYRSLRTAIREYYRTTYRLSPVGEALQPFIPGSCWVGYLSVEPRVADGMLRAQLQQQPTLRIFSSTEVTRVEVRDEKIYLVGARSKDQYLHFHPHMVLDATDLGDVLPLARAEHTLGAESKDQTGEPDAPDEAHPNYVQPFTFPFAVEFRPGESHVIVPPFDYDELKQTERYHLLDGAMTGMFHGQYPFWTYRRVLAAENFDDERIRYDVSMINTNSIDYKDAILPGATADDLYRARRAALGFLYWLQTECPREDEAGRTGYPELKLRKDFFNTWDGVAVAPYIRESRRIHALQTVLEQDIVHQDMGGTVYQDGPRARRFTNSCGIGDFFLDVHPGRADAERFMVTRPYQIPVDALVPVRIQNLLAACKNIGTTHLTNGAYRVHPLEWNIGESAGLLAAFCVGRDIDPSVLHEHEARLRPYQRLLLADGVPLFWWSDVPFGHAAFEATQMLGLAGFFDDGRDLRFRPDEPISDADLSNAAGRLGETVHPPDGQTRSQFAQWLYERVHIG